VGCIALPGTAAASQCPNSASTTDNEYIVVGTGTTTAVSCVNELDNGNLNGSTNPASSDDFLDGPDDNIATNDQYFQPGGNWTSFCTTNGSTDAGGCGTAYGFSWTGGGGSSGSWSFNGTVGSEYAIGLKDGSTPFWAVFLLSNTDNTNPVSYSGTWQIINGGLSHFVIYDRNVTPNVEPENPVPEPASLLLLGSGLALTAQRFRRRRQAQSL
jgi:hypothetical protein